MRKFNLALIDNKQAIVYEWNDVKDTVKGVIQLIHGSAEHALRYENFAIEMNKAGFIVIGMDLRGHGQTAQINNLPLGFFADESGWDRLCYDQKILNNYITHNYPKKTITVLGHSMGSFLARTYAIKYPNTFDKLILIGTANYPKMMLNFAYNFAKFNQLFKGKKSTGNLIWKLSYKQFDKSKIESEKDILNNWICSDIKVVNTFNEDPLCGFKFTVSGFKDMFWGLRFNQNKKNLKAMQNNMPILIMTGENDVVGEFTKTPSEFYDKLLRLGYKVEHHIYPSMKHEILNEIGKEKVFSDIINFLQ